MKLSPEKAALVAQYPALAPFAEANDMQGLRNLIKAIEQSIAATKPKAVKPTAQRDPYEGWSTKQLVDEGTRLAAEASRLAKPAGTTPSGESQTERDARQEMLDRVMGCGKWGPDAKRVVECDNAVQRFGVRAK